MWLHTMFTVVLGTINTILNLILPLSGNVMATITDRERQIRQRLRLRDLQVFFAVTQSGSMAKAAAELRITQPAVTRVIGELEAAFGARLFDRSTRGVEPTMYGRTLMKCSSAIFDELRQGIRGLEFLADPRAGELRIGCQVAITASVLPPIIQEFGHQFPRVIMHVEDVPTFASQWSGLQDRKYDLTVMRLGRQLTDEEQDELNVEVLLNDQLAVVVGMQSRWSHRRKVDLAELVNERWILPPANSVNYLGLEEAFQARGLHMPKASLVTLSVPLRAHLIATGSYVSALSRSALPPNPESRSLKLLRMERKRNPGSGYPRQGRPRGCCSGQYEVIGRELRRRHVLDGKAVGWVEPLGETHRLAVRVSDGFHFDIGRAGVHAPPPAPPKGG